MSTSKLREGFDRLVTDEPTMALDLTPVLASGRRLRRRRRTLAVAGGLAVTWALAAAVTVPVVLAHRDSKPDRLTVAPLADTGARVPAVKATDTAGLTSAQRRMLDAIQRASESGWTFEAGTDRWEHLNLEGTVDDGLGAGRLMIGVSPSYGSQQLHPCEDAEFRAGSFCTERELANGSVLSLRGVVDYRGIQYVDVALTHPDGSGVNAEAGNFIISWPPPRFLTAEEKKDLVHVTRSAPVYTVEQLGTVVVAVDEALRG